MFYSFLHFFSHRCLLHFLSMLFCNSAWISKLHNSLCFSLKFNLSPTGLIVDVTLFIHLAWAGGFGFFQLIKILWYANRHMKATTLYLFIDQAAFSGFALKLAVEGFGSICELWASHRDLKIVPQKWCKTGHSYSMWLKVAGDCLHQSQVESIFGCILDNLAFI